jgi:hypothetical protein
VWRQRFLRSSSSGGFCEAEKQDGRTALGRHEKWETNKIRRAGFRGCATLKRRTPLICTPPADPRPHFCFARHLRPGEASPVLGVCVDLSRDLYSTSAVLARFTLVGVLVSSSVWPSLSNVRSLLSLSGQVM